MIRFLIIAFLLITISCTQNQPKTKEQTEVASTSRNIVTEDYELVLPKNHNSLLILFPCFPCDAENTKTEFDILETAIENNIAVLLMNFNQHLWLSENEKKELENIIIDAISKNVISTQNTYIGGFSSGGNVSILLTDYLKSKDSSIQPKGLFIADSPIDLLGLYEVAQKVIAKNFSDVAIEEANWIVESFDAEFGGGEASLINYENKSPYVLKTHSIKNLTHLEDVDIRFYAEPDTEWWKENRQNAYEDLNAYFIENLTLDLNALYGEGSVNYIKTENKGYRSNGDRHPHSWSIIDAKELIDWMIK